MAPRVTDHFCNDWRCFFCLHCQLFLKIALLKDNPWYHKKGHRLLNPDNFQERETRYTKIEEQQKQEGEAFGQSLLLKIVG